MKISEHVNRLLSDSKSFRQNQGDIWHGMSGSKINNDCKSEVISSLESAKSLTLSVEKIISTVDKINKEVDIIKGIDNQIDDYNDKLKSYYSMSAARRAAIIGMDNYYNQQINALNREKKEHVTIINGYKKIIDSEVKIII